MLSPDRPFLISPPFGNYLRSRSAYSVLGSYTAEARPGRLGQILRTVRPVPGGWINAIGLRNPGMDSLPQYKRVDANGPFQDHQIVSLAPLADTDWHRIERWLDERRQRVTIEINISCPNVDEHPPLPPRSIVERIAGGGATVIVKLPPLERQALAATDFFVEAGVHYLHLSNTLPSPIGGISGRALRGVNLPLVERIATVVAGWSDDQVEIISGGGIYNPEHLRQYRDAGATRFSLATAWFWPPRALNVIQSTKKRARLTAGAPFEKY